MTTTIVIAMAITVYQALGHVALSSRGRQGAVRFESSADTVAFIENSMFVSIRWYFVIEW